jgi:hypothetical protein
MAGQEKKGRINCYLYPAQEVTRDLNEGNHLSQMQDTDNSATCQIKSSETKEKGEPGQSALSYSNTVML